MPLPVSLHFHIQLMSECAHIPLLRHLRNISPVLQLLIMESYCKCTFVSGFFQIKPLQIHAYKPVTLLLSHTKINSCQRNTVKSRVFAMCHPQYPVCDQKRIDTPRNKGYNPWSNEKRINRKRSQVDLDVKISF